MGLNLIESLHGHHIAPFFKHYDKLIMPLVWFELKVSMWAVSLYHSLIGCRLVSLKRTVSAQATDVSVE